MENNSLKTIHEYIKQLDSIEPVFSFEQVVREESYAVNEALARSFADLAFRAHIKNLVNKQVYNAAVNSNDINMQYFNAGRISIIKELYRDMERGYKIFLPKKGK